MVDTETGEFTEKTLSHEGNEVREFYAALEGPVVVGIEATGAMQWFLELLEELGMVCRVGHPAKIRAAPLLAKNARIGATLAIGEGIVANRRDARTMVPFSGSKGKFRLRRTYEAHSRDYSVVYRCGARRQRPSQGCT
jgi:transposase